MNFFVVIGIFSILIYIILICSVFKKFLKNLKKISLGYISHITYQNINFINRSLNNLSINIDSEIISSINIEYIKLEVYKNKLRFIFPKVILIDGNKVVSFVEFSNIPFLEFSPNSCIFSGDKFSVILKDKNNNKILSHKLEIDKLVITTSKIPLKIAFELDYHYINANNKLQKTNLNLEIISGISDSNKRNFIKSFILKKLNAKFHDSNLKAHGIMEFYKTRHPEGKFEIYIRNPLKITNNICTENNEFSTVLREFLLLIIKLSDSKERELDIILNFSEQGTTINNHPLAKIKTLQQLQSIVEL